MAVCERQKGKSYFSSHGLLGHPMHWKSSSYATEAYGYACMYIGVPLQGCRKQKSSGEAKTWPLAANQLAAIGESMVEVPLR